MPSISDEAICIRHWDFSETSQTVSLFTRQHGILRGLAKGSKREKGSFSGGIDVLTAGHVTAIVKPGRDLATLTEWHLAEPFWGLRQHLPSNRAALFVADMLHHMLTTHDPHVELYGQTTSALHALADPARVPATLLYWQWALLSETGYRPELDRDAETGEPLAEDEATLAFSPRSGGLVADSGGRDRWRVRRATVETVRRIAAGEVVDDVEPDVLDRANRLLAFYVREILGVDPPTMQWAFPGE